MEQLFLICLGLLLMIAAASDLRSYTIPNWLSISIVALFLLHAIVVRPNLSGLAIHLAAALAIFLLTALLFIKGAFGGGDVKLLSSLTLWVGLAALPRLLFVMAIAGGVLAIILIAARWQSKSAGKPVDRRVPYGIAIALAGIDFCLAQAHLAVW